MTITAQLADGRSLEFPDGTDPSVIQATVKKMVGARASIPAANTELTAGEKIVNALPDVVKNAIMKVDGGNLRGSATGRMMQGMADPGVGLAQLAANAMGQGDAVNKSIADTESKYQEARKAAGSEGFDPMRMAGNVAISALPLARVAPAATTVGRIGQSAAIGAMSGAAAPVTEGDYNEEKAKQTAVSGALGAILHAGWEAAKAGGRGIRNIAQSFSPEGIDKIVGRQWNLNAGDKREQIIKALSEYQPPASGAPLTAGQVAAPLNSAEFAAYSQMAQSAAPSKYYGDQGLIKAQADALSNYIDTVAKKGTTAKEDLINALRNETLPGRNQAMENANLAGVMVPKLESEISSKMASKVDALQQYGQTATESVKQQGLANRILDKTPYKATLSDALEANPGVKYYIESLPQKERAPFLQAIKDGESNAVNKLKNLGYLGDVRALRNRELGSQFFSAAEDFGAVAQQRQRELALKRMQLDSIPAEGFQVLKTDQLTKPLDSLLSTAGPRASDMLQKSIGAVNEKFKALSNNGVIDARDLDTVRKELGTTIKKAIMNPDGTWDANWAASQEIKIKKAIDEAINKAAGSTQYTDSLARYAEGMKGANDITIARELQKALISGSGKVRLDSFMNAMDRATQTPDMLRGGGAARFGNIEKAMTPESYSVMSNIKNELAAQHNFEDLAMGGMKKASENIGVGMPEIGPTGILKPEINLGRALINRIIGKEHGKVLERAGEVNVNPQLVAKLMENAKPYERQQLVDMLMQYQAAQAGQSQRN